MKNLTRLFPAVRFAAFRDGFGLPNRAVVPRQLIDNLVPFIRPLLISALLAFAGSSVAAAQGPFQWDLAADRVSADLADVPLRRVLEQIRVVTGWEVLLEPGVEFKISTSFENLKSGEALGRLLREANFAVIARTNSNSRLLVFRTAMAEATEILLQPKLTDESGRKLEDEWIVTLKPGSDPEALAARLGAKLIGRIDKVGAYRLKFDDASAALAARAALAADRSVLGVDANYSIPRPDIMMPMSGAAPPLPQIRPPSGNDGDRLTIGLVDTAVRMPPGELAKFMQPPLSLAGEVKLAGSQPSHAEGMLNDILAGAAGMLGAGSEGRFQVLAADIFGVSSETSTFQLGEGLVEVANRGATLINASLASKQESSWLNRIIETLADHNVLIVAAAGNTPDGLPTIPAAHPRVLAVTATNPGGQLAPYANFGPVVDIAMPGNSVVTLTGTPYFMSGTSVATARATGALAGYSLRMNVGLAAAETFLRQAKAVPAGGQFRP